MVGGSEEGEAEERGSVSSQERSEVVDTCPDYFFSCSPSSICHGDEPEVVVDLLRSREAATASIR